MDKIEVENCYFCKRGLILDDFGGVMRVNGELKFFCNRNACLMEFDEKAHSDQYKKKIIFYSNQKRVRRVNNTY